MQADAADLREIAEEAGILGIPDPSSMASRVSAGSLPPDRRAVSRSADSAWEKMHETSAPRSPRSVALAM